MFHENLNDRLQTMPTMRQAVDKYFFLKEADKQMNTVIEPVMREIAAELQSRGRAATIFKECQTVTDNGTVQPRHISLILSTENKRPACGSSRHPSISFVADSDAKTVWVRERKISSRGKKEFNVGEYQVDQITRQLIEKHIRGFLPEALKKA